MYTPIFYNYIRSCIEWLVSSTALVSGWEHCVKMILSHFHHMTIRERRDIIIVSGSSRIFRTCKIMAICRTKVGPREESSQCLYQCDADWCKTNKSYWQWPNIISILCPLTHYQQTGEAVTTSIVFKFV